MRFDLSAGNRIVASVRRRERQFDWLDAIDKFAAYPGKIRRADHLDGTTEGNASCPTETSIKLLF